MANGIDIVIGADVRGALTGLQQVEQRSKQVASSVGNASKGFNTFTTSSNQATLALSNLGRVAQDAPFGFIGIANNLNPLLESFQRLKATTGTTGGALKALAGSLTGAGGIGFALSIASSLAIVFGDKLFGASKKAQEHKEAIQLVETEYDRFSKRLKEVSDSIAKEATSFAFLTVYSNDATVSLKLRSAAISEINGKYSSYLSNLSQEVTSYNELSSAIQDNIKYLAVQAELKALLPALNKDFAKAIQLQVQLNELQRARALGENNLFGISEEDYQKESKVLEGQIRGILNSVTAAKKSFEIIAGSSKGVLDALFPDLGKTGIKELKVKPDKITIDRPALGSIKIELPTVLDPEKIDKSKIAAAVDRLEEALNKEFSLVGKELRLNLSPDVLLNQKNILAIQEATKGMSLEVAQGFRKNVLFFLGKGLGISGAIVQAMEIDKARVAINQLISQLAVDSISSLAEGLGNALAGGNLSNGFKAFADIIANGFMAIGKQMIAAAPIIAALKEAIRTLNPAVLLPAGIALVAIGAALRSSISSVRGSRASGGPVAAGVPYEVGEAGREIFVPSVSGSIIPNNRIGGYRGGGSQSTGRSRTYIRGNNLVLAMARTNRSQVRLG